MGVTQTLRVLLDVNSCVNAAASLVILWLIHGLRLRVRGYVLLIYSMTVCQFVFDLSLVMLFECDPTNSDCLNSCFFLASSFGIASQAWSLCVAMIVAYIVASRRRFPIDKWYGLMFFLIASSSIAVGTIRLLASTTPDFGVTVKQSIYIYDSMRYIEILVNFSVVLLIFSHLRGMNYHELQDNAVYQLARKLLLYPAVQLLSRIGSTQYEDIYGTVFPTDNEGWDKQSIQAILYAALTPLGGFLSMLIFLVVQPGAYRLLRATVACESTPAAATHSAVKDDRLSSSRSAADRQGGDFDTDNIDVDADVDADADENQGGGADFHERDSSVGSLSVAALSSLHGSRVSTSLAATAASAYAPDNSLSTVFSATARSSLHMPRRLADLSEEQLVEVIAAESGAGAGGGGVGSIFKSASGNDLQRSLLP